MCTVNKITDFFKFLHGMLHFFFIFTMGLRPIYVMFFKFFPISFQMKNNDEMWF